MALQYLAPFGGISADKQKKSPKGSPPTPRRGAKKLADMALKSPFGDIGDYFLKATHKYYIKLTPMPYWGKVARHRRKGAFQT